MKRLNLRLLAAVGLGGIESSRIPDYAAIEAKENEAAEKAKMQASSIKAEIANTQTAVAEEKPTIVDASTTVTNTAINTAGGSGGGSTFGAAGSGEASSAMGDNPQVVSLLASIAASVAKSKEPGPVVVPKVEPTAGQ